MKLRVKTTVADIPPNKNITINSSNKSSIKLLFTNFNSFLTNCIYI